MTFHPFVLAYGQRRGYAMADLHRILPQESSLFSTPANEAVNDPPIAVSLASDLTLNLSEPSIYLKELQLFSAFFNSLPLATRRRLQPYTEGAVLYFAQKLSQYGHPSDILASALDEFQPPNDIDSEFCDAVTDSYSDERQLVKNFLTEFRLPLLCEYFNQETSLLSSSLNGHDANVPVNDTQPQPVKNEMAEDSESEKEEDNVEDPPWWKPNVQVTVGEDSDTKKEVEELDSILAEIRDVCAKLPDNNTRDESFPFSMKMYNLSKHAGTRGRNQRPSANCADMTRDGRLACFGCDGDSTIRCFPIRRPDISPSRASSTDSSFVLRAGSSAGIIYRLGLVESSSDGQFLLATTDDTSRPVHLYDLASAVKIYDYRGHQWPTWALDTSERGGGMFITGSYDRTARLFLLDRRDPIRVFVGHESSVDCVQFIPSPHEPVVTTDMAVNYPPFIATASSDGTVRLWSLADAIAVRVFHGMKGWPTALAYGGPSSGGSAEPLLACATTEAKIFIWELESGRIHQVLEGVLANDLQFTPDGRYLVAGGDYGCFKIYRSSIGVGDSGNQFVEIQISENLLFHNIEAKFLKIKFRGDEVICLAA